jgi:hypothetical protein
LIERGRKIEPRDRQLKKQKDGISVTFSKMLISVSFRQSEKQSLPIFKIRESLGKSFGENGSETFLSDSQSLKQLKGGFIIPDGRVTSFNNFKPEKQFSVHFGME